MRRGAAAAAILLVAAAAPPPPAEAGPAGGLARDRKFQERVDRAIERGVETLLRLRSANGSFGDPGHSALATYTLAACVDDPGSPDVARSFRRLRESMPAPRMGGVYGTSLCLLALDARRIRGGGGGPLPDRKELAWARDLTDYLVKGQGRSGGFSYGSPNPSGTWDNSNTQYALLGLKAARRLGLEVPDEVWRRALEHFLREQEGDGPSVDRVETAGVDEKGYGSGKKTVGKDRARGWGYHGSGTTTGSMTAGGVSSLAICRSELAGKRGHSAAADRMVVRAMRDGVAWLGRHFSVRGNPMGVPGRVAMDMPSWHYYYLYGLERAGVLAGVSWMADHDWYGEGAEFLCAAQKDDGSWSGTDGRAAAGRPALGFGGRGGLEDTCFALLFLKKATFRDSRGAVATEEDDRELNLDGAADLDDATYAAVFAAVLGRFARAKPARRAELAPDFVRMGSRSLGLLILRLDEDTTEERAVAADALERITGETRGFVADGPDAARAAAVAAWEEWYAPRRRRLVADLEAGVFVERR